MKVVVIGSGGREQVILWRLQQEDSGIQLFALPGNGGSKSIAECVPLSPDDQKGIKDFVIREKIDLVIVGPEDPLIAGLVDLLEKEKIPTFGPRQRAARLEGSKAWAKQFMQRWEIPTGRFQIFSSADKARTSIEQGRFPIVIKADGPARGKGVRICQDKETAREAIRQFMEDKIFGESGQQIIIEEHLAGTEFTLLAFFDSKNFILLPPSQDHKRIGEGDTGPNTGGMGAYAPTPFFTPELRQKVQRDILEPFRKGLQATDIPYHGIIYFGIIITDGGPKVLEFNVRFGDPETQVVLPLMGKGIKFTTLLEATIQGRLGKLSTVDFIGTAGCVVLAAKGYPDRYSKGERIEGLAAAAGLPGVLIFHAGTEHRGNEFFTNGGRVLNVVGLGKDFSESFQRAYQATEQITFPSRYFRRDIGWQVRPQYSSLEQQ